MTMTVALSHFWFQSAYERILATLPTSRPSHFVEVGVLAGASTVWLGAEILKRGLPVTLHCVDTFDGWDETPQGEELRAIFDENTRELVPFMRDRFKVHAMPSVEAAKMFADQSINVVWLDADHSYEAVKADIEAWRPKVRSGGTLGGDDWSFGGVAKAVQEAFGSRAITLGDGLRHSTRWPWWMVRV